MIEEAIETIEAEENSENTKPNLTKEKISEYKEIFNKYDEEKTGFLSAEKLSKIFEEYKSPTTETESEKLISDLTKDNKINFDQFLILIEKKLHPEKEENKETLTTCQIYLFMLLLLITGSINTTANKLQQNTESLGIKYKGHQKFITFCMFNGELICLLIYYIKERRKKKSAINENDALLPRGSSENPSKEKENENIEQLTKIEKNENNEKNEKKELKEAKFWYFLFPAVFDILGSSISSISLSFLASSIYQMFRGAIIIFTCTSSIIFLKSKFYRHHFLGIFIVIGGLCIVGLNAILNSDGNATGENPELGIFLVILSQLFSAGLFITEEKIVKNYKVHPLKAVGMEGLWGVCCYIILLFIFYFIRCEQWPDNLKDGVCIKNEDDEYRFENAIFAVKQIINSPRLVCYVLLYVCSIASFNFAGLTVTKHVSSTARTVVDTLRTIVIWVFFLTPIVPKDTQEKFSRLQLLGFSILIVGGVIYNEIIEIPFWGFNQNTKRAIKEREEKENEEKEKEK